MKNISKKTAGIVAAVIVVVIAAALIAVNVMKVSPVEAEQIALNQAGGGVFRPADNEAEARSWRAR